MDIAIRQVGTDTRQFRLPQEPQKAALCEEAIFKTRGVMVVDARTTGGYFIIKITAENRVATDRAFWLTMFNLIAATANWEPGKDKVTTF